MTVNGTRAAEDEDVRPQLRKVREIDAIVPALNKAAKALMELAVFMERIEDRIVSIGADTARAASDTVELKRHLKAITDREQGVRVQLKAVTDRELELRAEVETIKKLWRKKRRKKARRGRRLS